jgi:hypothetical protein
LYIDVLTSDRTFIDSYETTQSDWSTVTWTWVNWQYQNIQVKYDWIFVRKYISPEPTAGVGVEETGVYKFANANSWQYRRAIVIDNSGNPNTLTDYQVLVQMDTASLISGGKMRVDCGDIRFTDTDGQTLLSYWIEGGCNLLWKSKCNKPKQWV